MKAILLLLLFSSFNAFAQQIKLPEPVLLPNGWSLTPVGKSLQLGDLPLNIAVSPSKKYMAVTNNGQSTQSIQLIYVKREIRLDSIDIPKSWMGLKFSADEKYLYASGGNDNLILKYAIIKNKLILKDSFILGKAWPVKISPTGFDVDDAKQLMYVVTKENNSLYLIDMHSKNVIQKDKLGAEAYTCLLSPDKNELYISVWGGDKVKVFNTITKKFTDSIAVGDNPNDMCLTKNGKYLYVANANDNSVSVINIKERKLIETLNAALYPDSRQGSTTNSVALSANEKELYIANADNNCLAVFDVEKPGSSVSKGFIPVGWYPTCVRVVKNKIFVANAKGFTSMSNALFDPFTPSSKMGYQKGDYTTWYIGGLFRGTLSIIPVPKKGALSVYSRQVYKNTPYNKSKELESAGEKNNPIPTKVGDTSPIKYVFYIIKENRTYDQVLGDMPEGNGDTSLCLFGEKITPNLHALAREFVLLDNFYVNAEVSADGHNWSMGGYADDYLEKTWPTSYGNRGGSYAGEGTLEIANNKGGFLWNYCARAGISYRTYGEFIEDYKPNLPVLKDHFCKYFTGWNLNIRDTVRFGQWKKDFDSLLAINELPHFNSIRFPGDHTEGLKKGSHTPFSYAADNDLAVGMFLDHLSKSPVWKESAVFIVEDDAQDGPDHVDAHRSTAYVAGGFVKRHFVDHTMYSTTSVLRTMELILGLPPMSQYDASSPSMWRSFQATPDSTGFIVKALQVDLDDKNKGENAWQRKSEKFNFTKEDAIPDNEFSEVIWKAVKGIDSKMPAPRRAAFVNQTVKKDDD
ncbi:MAG: bifunctional YncE family protein/alkaline phosphatase family protein [Ginsengibacter sp.]